MQIRELSISGAFELTPRQFSDDRGVFWEWYRFDALAEVVGHPMNVKQGNGSVSKRGVVRGIHFAEVPPSQAKYVQVLSGAILDFVIDIRLGSPTFGQWESVRLDTTERRALYIAEGLGHAFVALEDNTTVTYLVSETYSPTREHGITPLDPTIGLEFPTDIGDIVLSPKDTAAPSLEEAERAGLLPSYEETRAYTRSLSQRWLASARD